MNEKLSNSNNSATSCYDCLFYYPDFTCSKLVCREEKIILSTGLVCCPYFVLRSSDLKLNNESFSNSL